MRGNVRGLLLPFSRTSLEKRLPKCSFLVRYFRKVEASFCIYDFPGHRILPLFSVTNLWQRLHPSSNPLEGNKSWAKGRSGWWEPHHGKHVHPLISSGRGSLVPFLLLRTVLTYLYWSPGPVVSPSEQEGSGMPWACGQQVALSQTKCEALSVCSWNVLSGSPENQTCKGRLISLSLCTPWDDDRIWPPKWPYRPLCLILF